MSNGTIKTIERQMINKKIFMTYTKGILVFYIIYIL